MTSHARIVLSSLISLSITIWLDGQGRTSEREREKRSQLDFPPAKNRSRSLFENISQRSGGISNQFRCECLFAFLARNLRGVSVNGEMRGSPKSDWHDDQISLLFILLSNQFMIISPSVVFRRGLDGLIENAQNMDWRMRKIFVDFSLQREMIIVRNCTWNKHLFSTRSAFHLSTSLVRVEASTPANISLMLLFSSTSFNQRDVNLFLRSPWAK